MSIQRRLELIRCARKVGCYIVTHFQDQVRVIGQTAGMHVVAEFSGMTFTEKLMRAVEEAGVSVMPVNEHAIIKGNHDNRIILGYAHLDQGEIEEGLLRLKEALL